MLGGLSSELTTLTEQGLTSPDQVATLSAVCPWTQAATTPLGL